MLKNQNNKASFKSNVESLKSKKILDKVSGGRGGGSIVLVDENGRIV
ncbi:hypothetical protein [Pseudoalteromonas luteoviolacea]|uniref:Uncharacterized protein n=1 Tax=Pseudoalteromonas luteoviolacea H33 TaxID=1365251 RepID=A0A167AUA7_9GAMM|nr:hypothetical protein [Pseudoalteromonas luteoviolacea]KZN45811.1 hypothetical protein N476_24925 [Pseudoalteromonas luteoviolacea H33]KZN76930.1 hypothetical protein N477_13805 [Pseudoalteromonas luteoviolacea H33-S]MBQ4880233.1 hypothetical protein [Pseudoalteromonas luteoviolacea]MBQ4909294.1 hypothetical protein [Pseudoalteromonas luteoviolacea]